MERPKKYFLVISVAILFLAINRFIFRERIFLPIGDFLIIQDELQLGDVIHVIAGLDHRTDHGIQLFKLGVGKRILFTKGWCPNHNYSHGEYSKKRALGMGIPSEGLAADDSRVASTYSEIVRLKKLVKKYLTSIPSKSSVSAPPHRRRVYWSYRQPLGKDIASRDGSYSIRLSFLPVSIVERGGSRGVVYEFV